MNQKVDAAILGAGTAGLSALEEVKKENKSFVIIDPGPLGTTCARTGCMPQRKTGENTHRALQGVRVLLAHDSDDNQFLVRCVLTNNGAVVETAKNGMEFEFGRRDGIFIEKGPTLLRIYKIPWKKKKQFVTPELA